MKISNKDKAKALAAYYANQTDLRSQKIKEIISQTENLKLQFPNRTKLSEYVAIRLGEMENSKVSASTIRRNENYNSHLINYFLRVNPEKVRNKVDNLIDTNLIARDLRKQISEQQREINELKIISNEAQDLLEKRLGLEYLEKQSTRTALTDKIKLSNEESDESVFELLYKYMNLIGSMEFNVKNGYILDDAENEVVMNRDKFPKFFKWLEKKINA